MAEGPGFKVSHRRRREQKTDFKKRIELIKSGKPRAVVRISNNHTEVQVVSYEKEGDEVITGAKSFDLKELGWEHHTGNLPSAYLTGLLAGQRAFDEEVEEAVVDLGLQMKQHGSRVFAAIKGLEDSGLEVNAGENAFPEESRIKGEHIEEFKDNGIVSNFENVKEKIMSDK